MITGMPRIAIAAGDFDGLLDTFKNKLGMPVVDLSDHSVESLGAKLAMCVPEGGSNIELMCPAVPQAPLSQSLQRFLDRRGDGPFALMLEAADPNAEAEELLGRGLNVLPLMDGAGGRDVHPNSTHGVLIRVYPVNSFKGEASAAEKARAGGLSGIKKVIIAVNDLDSAIKVYGERFGMSITAADSDANRGVRVSICNPPTGGAIELVQVEDDSKPFARCIGEFLNDRPEGIYALVLSAENPAGMRADLTNNGLVVHSAADSSNIIEIARESMFGALVRIEPR